jgi:hypothetical protein
LKTQKTKEEGFDQAILRQDRAGNYMEVFTGKIFWPLDPRVDEINVIDIAHSLSNQCRFAGHVDDFYSVAQHSVLVSMLLPEELWMTGLMHDASEAYLVDVPRPIKPFLKGYDEIEKNIMTCVAIKFRLKWPMPKEVKTADNTALAIEKRCFKKRSTQVWDCEYLDNKQIILDTMSPKEAEQYFLNRFEIINDKKANH